MIEDFINGMAAIIRNHNEELVAEAIREGRVVVSQWIEPGKAFVMDFNGDRKLVVQNLSTVLTSLRGATYHYRRNTCPTWTDDCACMVDPS